jgi:hypothetical protein
MSSFFSVLIVAMIVCGLANPVFSQSTTIQDAAKHPAVYEALSKKIERDKLEVKAYKVGHVIVGRILLEGSGDPEFVRSQMMIFKEGFFSDAVRDLDRPIAFRRLGYHPVDAMIPAGAIPDDSGAIDIGTIQMKKCAPSEFRKATGMIAVPDGADLFQVQVKLHLSGGRANTPHNGTEPVRKHAAPVEAKIGPSGQISADGLTEGDYYVTFNGEGFVSQAKTYQVTSDKDLDLGIIQLEQPIEISIQYIVAQNPSTSFAPDAVKETKFPAGTKWKSRPMNEWDLEFVQTAGTVKFNYFYSPCAMADLGEGQLVDFVNTDLRTAKMDPRSVPFTSGHVYLLNHQQSLKHAVLFRVEVLKSSTDTESTSPGKK